MKTLRENAKSAGSVVTREPRNYGNGSRLTRSSGLPRVLSSIADVSTLTARSAIITTRLADV